MAAKIIWKLVYLSGFQMVLAGILFFGTSENRFDDRKQLQ
jgi:hypothetical protein